MQLAFGVLLVVLLTELINLVGKAHVTTLAYDIYLKVVNKETMVKQRQLKKEVLTLKNDLSRTSSQDEFAKWAKLRRKMDSKIAELDKLTSELHLTKASFEIKFKSLLWFITNGIQFFMITWFRRSPMFYLPHGWFGPAEHVLALPFAERGAVSISIWFYFCRKTILLFTSNLAEFVPAVRAWKQEQPSESSSNPFAAFANMASMASAAGGSGPGSPGSMGGNPFAAMGGMGGMDFGASGMEGMAGMDTANMFGPGSPFAAMFGQTLSPNMGGGSGASSPTPSRSSSVRGAGNLGRGEDRRRKV
ncbi:GET complex subunit get1 [Entomortierella chlamydospora]|uniref:GET complex subunit get1 n=1 Tax=Entomortierella chlamydospora TaxID=101097 RepID=A0A9P6MTH8_9FUNG|nr:GET complex subunit get1 [Entomortierella chlamydospora]KAG0012037.1 GET complex subunit get1 [Entomortierella chlamydospora]